MELLNGTVQISGLLKAQAKMWLQDGEIWDEPGDLQTSYIWPTVQAVFKACISCPVFNGAKYHGQLNNLHVVWQPTYTQQPKDDLAAVDDCLMKEVSISSCYMNS